MPSRRRIGTTRPSRGTTSGPSRSSWRGTLLTAAKSKANPEYSTFRIGDDAYTVRTGELHMAADQAEATLHYQTFTGKIRWDIDTAARLTLETDTDREVTTALTVGEGVTPTLSHAAEERMLVGFSPYSAGSRAPSVRALVVRWRGRMTAEFQA